MFSCHRNLRTLQSSHSDRLSLLTCSSFIIDCVLSSRYNLTRQAQRTSCYILLVLLSMSVKELAVFCYDMCYYCSSSLPYWFYMSLHFYCLQKVLFIFYTHNFITLISLFIFHSLCAAALHFHTASMFHFTFIVFRKFCLFSTYIIS